MLRILHQDTFYFLGYAHVRCVGDLFAGVGREWGGWGMCLPFGWFADCAGEWLAGSSGLGISGLLLLSPCGMPGLGVSGLH